MCILGVCVCVPCWFNCVSVFDVCVYVVLCVCVCVICLSVCVCIVSV